MSKHYLPAKNTNRMDVFRACIFALLLVAVTAAPQEDGKRVPGRFYISLSDIPFLGSFFSHYTGNGTASNKTTTLKHLELYPILPSLVTSGEQLNATAVDANGKANCNQHNNHIHPQSDTHMEGTQKLTTAAPVGGIILDSKIQSTLTQDMSHLKPAKGSTANTLINPSLSLAKPADAIVPHLSSHQNTVISNPVDGQKQPSLIFQNPFSLNKISSEPNASQDQGISAAENPSAVSTEKPGFFEIFHATEASQTTSATTKRPTDNYWSETFGIPSYSIMPGYTKPPALPQNPQITTQQNPVNAPNYPFFPFNQWPGAIQMPGAFGIPEGAANLPNAIFQYPPQFGQSQLPITNIKEHNVPFVNIWPTNQPQKSPDLQNDVLNSNNEIQQSTGAPHTSQQTGSPQNHQVHHIQPVYGQHNWYQGFPYVPYSPQLSSSIANSQGNIQVLPEMLQQNSAGSFQHTTSTKEQEMASHHNHQMQRFPQNYKSIYAPLSLMLQRL